MSASGGFNVVPNDGVTFKPTAGVFVGGAGNLVVTMADGGPDVTFSNVPAGRVVPIMVVKVKAATTATLIVALT